MGYRVDNDALDALYTSISTETGEWQDELEGVFSALSALAESTNMSGTGADSIRSYIQTVHATILSTISELLSLHTSSFLLYKNDYQSTIDTSLHAVIDEEELETIREKLSRNKDAAVAIYENVEYTLRQVSDIFQVGYRDVSGVDKTHQEAVAFMTELDEKIHNLESNHSAQDFVETEELLRSLHLFIAELENKGRSYKTGFDPRSLARSSAFASLYAAHLAVEKKQADMAPAIETALNNEQQRIEQIEAERAQRERDANTWRWIITGACIVGSIAAIALTGGAATPLVVGAISAASGAIIAGTNNLADQYIENGDLSKSDWSSFGKDVLVGGITGFVTGYAGAAVSGAITSGLSSTAVGSSMLNSSNALTRIGTGAVIGSVSEVGSGVVSRGAGTFISSGGDLDAALEDAFSLENIAYDATIGGVMGGISAARNAPEVNKLEPEKQQYQKETGWSDDVVNHIDSDQQLDIYKNANLTEAEVNGRPALVKEIDYDYIDEKTGLSNRELMSKGRSPIDAATGEKIELHHMGQDYDAPFAELCENSEHGDGNHSILHPKTEDSWRNTEGLELNYNKERKQYWKSRSLMEMK